MMNSRRPRDVINQNWLLLCVTGIIGLRPFELYRSKFIGYLYVIITLTCYFILFYFSINYSMEFFATMELITKSINIRRIQMILNVFILPFMIITSVFTYDKMKKVFTDIHDLDKKLEKFNVDLNYKKFMKENIIHILGIIILTILMGLVEYYSLIRADSTYMYDLMWITNLLPQIVHSISLATFVVILEETRRRHIIINNLIFEIGSLQKNKLETIVSTEVNNGNTSTGGFILKPRITPFKFRFLRQLYEICKHIISTINEAYELILLISTVLIFIIICAHLKIIYTSFGEIEEIVDVIVDSMWVCFYFGKLVYITDACHSIGVQGKCASKLLHECRVDTNHHLLKQENDSFARQIGDGDIRIMACNFFTIDYSLLTKVVLALTTYVFFLSQFSYAK